MRLLALVLALLAPLAAAQAPQPGAAKAALHLVLIWDGLRPDSINPADTPNLFGLRAEGVTFAHSHAVFPTVTRVNATSLATGTYPARHGIMGNQIYVPAVDAQRAFSNDDHRQLLRMDEAQPGRIATAPALAELLEKHGQRLVAVSSGSTGSALLLAPRAPRGSGTVINGDFVPGKQAAFPEAVSAEVLKRFGPAPKKGGAQDPFDASVGWAMQVLRDYVLPELKPSVVLNWMTEPDHIQHAFGAGAPQSVASIRRNDEQLGRLLQALEARGLREKTSIFVVSDHGFGQTVHNVNVGQAFVEAGFANPEAPQELVVASSGQTIALHVAKRDPARIRALVEFLQRQSWTGLIFTAAKPAGAPHEGTVPGTFSLEYAHLGGHERSPDIVFTFPWSSAKNRHGVPGADYNHVTGGPTGPVDVQTANHGSLSPWTVRNTMLASGPDFKRGATLRTPASNVDVAPTLLHLLGHADALRGMDGRPLLEALAGGPDEEQVAMETKTLRVRHGDYQAVLQVSEVEGRRYLDKGWRAP